MHTKYPALIVLLAALLGTLSCSSSQDKDWAVNQLYEQDLVQYAKPMCGTGQYPGYGGNNNCFPGSVAPFGMIQWSPDTETINHKSGYFDRDKNIIDFS